MAELIYGFDPLCGWCYGIVPAMRRVAQDHPDIPIHLVMGGLISGDGVGPYAEMQEYICGAVEHLREVTGRAPTDEFFQLIATPGVEGNSEPPCIAFAHAAGCSPDRAVEFAHKVIEAHFEHGADQNDPATYAPLLASIGVTEPLPDIHDEALAQAVWEQGRRIGLRSFPTLAVLKDGQARVLPSEYDPARLSALVAEAAK